MSDKYKSIDTDLDDFYTEDCNGDKPHIDDKNKPKNIAEQNQILDEIFKVATTGNTNMFTKIVKEHKWTLNTPKIGGLSILHMMTFMNKISLMQILINLGANINIIDNNEQTPMHYAVMSNSLETVKFLIKKKADINMQDNTGNTPLHLAVINNCFDIVESLIANNVNPFIKNNNERTACDYSIIDGGIFALLRKYINKQ